MSRKLKTGLILGSVALAFYVAVIVKYWILNG